MSDNKSVTNLMNSLKKTLQRGDNVMSSEQKIEFDKFSRNIRNQIKRGILPASTFSRGKSDEMETFSPKLGFLKDKKGNNRLDKFGNTIKNLRFMNKRSIMKRTFKIESTLTMMQGNWLAENGL